ncbi:MAG: NAD(P)/FAD-dependent oxidoreductase [Candidatus Helarchaeota archaeon]
MIEQTEILIVGAGTAGVYFGWLMAKKGYSVLIIEKDPREKVGKRLDIFHIDSIRFDQFGVPPPEKDSPELIAVHEEGLAHSPDGQITKKVKYSFHVMRLTPFLQRLFKLAESAGVEFEFSCKFIGLIYENQKIIGVIVEHEGEKHEIRAKLVVDASGTASVVRTTLPEEYGVENFKLGPDDVLYVILRYIKWTNPNDPHPTGLNLWPLHKVFCNPSYDKERAILGIGQPGSYDNAEQILNDFFSMTDFPPFEIEKFERGITPYRRPPYSLVSDAFLCMGDSACITKPFSGEGITATWTLCKIASDVVDLALQTENYLSKELLWDINVQYFREQGAKFAELFAQLPGAANTTAKEMIYLFKKNIIFSEKDLVEVNRDFEVKLSTGKTLKIVFSMLWGLLTRKFSRKNLSGLLHSLSIASKIRKHYENYPKEVLEFKNWVKKASTLWEKALF